MPEDFGDWGDEAFLGFCAEDWRDYAPVENRFDERRGQRALRERQRELEDERQMEELALEFYDADLCDIVRQHEEEFCDPDYPEQVGQDISEFDSDEDYLNCDFEE